MERILLLEDDKSLVTGLAAALLAAECAAWAVCPALCLPLLGLFVLLSAGTYAASGLLVGVAAGLVLHLPRTDRALPAARRAPATRRQNSG